MYSRGIGNGIGIVDLKTSQMGSIFQIVDYRINDLISFMLYRIGIVHMCRNKSIDFFFFALFLVLFNKVKRGKKKE